MNNPYQTGWNQWNGFGQDNAQNQQNNQQQNPQNNQQNNQQNAQQGSQQNMGQDWTQNPNLRGMDPEKLKMLNSIASQGSQKGMNELLPFLMSAASQNKSNGLNFTPREIDTIIEVLKMGKPPQEAARMERMLQIIKMMR